MFLLISHYRNCKKDVHYSRKHGISSMLYANKMAEELRGGRLSRKKDKGGAGKTDEPIKNKNLIKSIMHRSRRQKHISMGYARRKNHPDSDKDKKRSGGKRGKIDGGREGENKECENETIPTKPKLEGKISYTRSKTKLYI